MLVHTKGVIMKNRFNVSLSNECIMELERIADELQSTRSGAIEYLAKKNRDGRWKKSGNDDIQNLKRFLDDLISEINNCERFEQRDVMARDAFYQLVGYALQFHNAFVR